MKNKAIKNKSMKSKSMKSKSVKSKSMKSKPKHSMNVLNMKSQSVKGGSGNENNTDIIELILRDHKPLKKSIAILVDEKVNIEIKDSVYLDFSDKLSRHAKAEEESLYVEMKDDHSLRLEGLEGDTEHAIAVQLMKEIDGIVNDDDLWLAKVKVLAEVVEHHVKEEEQEMLKAVRKEFDLETRQKIGQKYMSLLDGGDSDEHLDEEHSNVHMQLGAGGL